MALIYDEDELKTKTPIELKKIAKKHGIDLAGITKKSEIVELLAMIDDDEDETDEELDEEDEVETDEEEAEEADDEAEEEADEDEELAEEELDDEEVDEPAPKKKAAKKAPPKKAAAAEGDTLAAKQVATVLGTDAKVLRQFFRSEASTVEPVGSGGRYEFAKSDIDKIKKEFEAWRSAHAARGSKRGPSKGKGGKPAEEVPEVEDIEELEEDEELDDELDDEDLELEEDED